MSPLTLHEHPFPVIQWGTVLGASLVAAGTDLRSRRIPNLLTGPVFALGLVASGVVGGAGGVVEALLTALLLALPYVLLFAFAGGGAGDAKLMGALGAWLGLYQGAALLFAVSMSGVVLAVLHAHRRARLRATLADASGLAKALTFSLSSAGSLRELPALLPLAQSTNKMPYGLAIFVGSALAAIGWNLWLA